MAHLPLLGNYTKHSHLHWEACGNTVKHIPHFPLHWLQCHMIVCSGQDVIHCTFVSAWTLYQAQPFALGSMWQHSETHPPLPLALAAMPHDCVLRSRCHPLHICVCLDTIPSPAICIGKHVAAQ